MAKPGLPPIGASAELRLCESESLPEAAPPALRSQPALALPLLEVLGFDARLLLRLPLPATLLVSAHEGERCSVQTSPAAPPAGTALVFVGPEWSALVLAAEHERANAVTLARWCAKKREKPAWRLTSAEAIGRLGHSTPERGWPVERVLGALGVRLEEVLV